MKVRVPRRASCRLRWSSVSTGLPPVIRLWPRGWADPAIGPGDRALETHTYRPSLILQRPGPLSDRQRPVLVPTVVTDSLSSQLLAPGMRSFPCEACGASEVAAPDGRACPLHPPYYNLPCSVARGPGSPTGQSRDEAAHPFQSRVLLIMPHTGKLNEIDARCVISTSLEVGGSNKQPQGPASPRHLGPGCWAWALVWPCSAVGKMPLPSQPSEEGGRSPAPTTPRPTTGHTAGAWGCVTWVVRENKSLRT